MAKYPNSSPYASYNNNPVFFTDPFGDDPPEKLGRWGRFKNWIKGDGYRNHVTDYARENNIDEENIFYNDNLNYAAILENNVTSEGQGGDNMSSEMTIVPTVTFVGKNKSVFLPNEGLVDPRAIPEENEDGKYRWVSTVINVKGVGGTRRYNMDDLTVDEDGNLGFNWEGFYYNEGYLGGDAPVPSIGRVKSIVKLSSLLKNPSSIIKQSKKAWKSSGKSFMNLLNQAKNGNLNPGIGTKFLTNSNGIYYLRAKDGARIFFRHTDDGVEILAYANKSNEAKVIKELLKNH